MATPLIRTLQASGGTFYAFSSASRDLSKTVNSDKLKFEFSKFALLNIPNVERPDTPDENFIQFNTIDGSIQQGLNADNNINLSQSFQNYALNLERLILEHSGYNHNLMRTVSERVFFKWLKELGAIRFRKSLNTESNNSLIKKTYSEELNIDKYQRVVQYLGEIDVTNSLQKAGQSYTEIYINVPTRVGNTPVVLFEQYADDNYGANLTIQGLDEFIEGRNINTIHPDGLDIHAYYDYDSITNFHNQPVPANWGLFDDENSYYTEPSSSLIVNNKYFKFDENVNSVVITKTPSDYLVNTPGFGGVTYNRSTMDGISIDFTDNDYYKIAKPNDITTIQEYNSSDDSVNFDFNAVLVYYDIYETSNPDNRATNLYGVIFLDNLTPAGIGDGAYIQRLQKFKPNKITGLNGNAWSLILNLKFDTTVENAAIETIINEYNTFSMDLFIDASTQLQEAVKTLSDTQHRFLEIANRVDELEEHVFTSKGLEEFKIRLEELEQNVENAKLALGDSTSLLDLIVKNNDTIQHIINGTIPVDLQFNTDVIKNGDGTEIDKSVPGKIKINNITQSYNILNAFEEFDRENQINATNMLDLNSNNIECYVKLKKYTNLLRLYTENIAISDLHIYIDDIGAKFKTGQSVIIHINPNDKNFKDSSNNQIIINELQLSNKNIEIYTDTLDKFGNGSLSKRIAIINASDLISDRPILELICIDEDNYEFVLDVIK